MNKRLKKLYLSIENQHLSDFLQNKIILDKKWGKKIWGITLQIMLSPEIKNEIKQLQSYLEKIEFNNLLFVPLQYNHISFQQVVYWAGQYPQGQLVTWDSINNKFISKFSSLNYIYSAFDIFFFKLIPTTDGIIWCAYDSEDQFQELRKKLFKDLPFPKETKLTVNIIHTTIARYKNKLNNPKMVAEYLKQYDGKFFMRISKICLYNELIWPSMELKPIAELNLK